MGGYLLSRFSNLRVDVHEPDLVIFVEIRDQAAYIHGPQLDGAGGMPVGSSGKAMLLVSGGIDSPVSGLHDGKARPGNRGLTLPLRPTPVNMPGRRSSPCAGRCVNMPDASSCMW